MAEIYRSEILIRFSHCDPAGIVFFPRYLEMFNDIVEDWCREELGFNFAEIHLKRGWGIPTVHLDVDFFVPSTLGDRLTATLRVNKIGRSSIGFDIAMCGADGAERLRGKQVVVFIDAATKKSAPIPDAMRAQIARFYDA
ncbi:MAG TPA: thioesterase family protein [Gemmatimonadaceae bacterium]|nr:thioesterase family protein [Gemmatimonadaceae bacterium]